MGLFGEQQNSLLGWIYSQLHRPSKTSLYIIHCHEKIDGLEPFTWLCVVDDKHNSQNWIELSPRKSFGARGAFMELSMWRHTKLRSFVFSKLLSVSPSWEFLGVMLCNIRTMRNFFIIHFTHPPLFMDSRLSACYASNVCLNNNNNKIRLLKRTSPFPPPKWSAPPLA